MKSFRYITTYLDITMFNDICELVHFAPSLPQAIKDGRAYVRDLNNEYRRHFPGGLKRYHYSYTYRSR